MINNVMKKLNLCYVLCITVLVIAGMSTLEEAYAHASWYVPHPDDVNKTIRLVVGETKEPAFADELHNIEIKIEDKNTKLPVTNAYLDAVSLKDSPRYTWNQSLFVDAYFYPRGTSPAVNDHPDCTDVTKYKKNSEDTSYGCSSDGNEKASKIAQKVRGQHGRAGYYQADYQWYSEPGKTLYHVYGHINYFNDVLIPVSLWTDGGAVSIISNGQDELSKFRGGFGLKQRADTFWPPAEQFDSIRDGQSNMYDLLKEIHQYMINNQK